MEIVRKKNVAILSWSLNNGGAERAAANLSKDLAEKYNIFLIVFDSSNIAYPYSGELIDIGVNSGKTYIGRILSFFKKCFKIKRIKKEKKIDVTISFMPHVNFYNVLSKSRDKTIISIRNNMTQKGLSKFGKEMIKVSRKKSNITVSLSEGVREDLINNFAYKPNEVVTIYNSCDVNWFMRESEEIDKIIENFDFYRPTIVTVGRMTYQKGQWHLLRAFSEVTKQIPNCQLVIFGDGELKEDLKAYAKSLNIRENVYMFGYVKNHHKFIKKCTAFVFPSLFEGLGNALLEALACELPTISTDCLSGPSEILNKSNPLNNKTMVLAKYGILVPNFSAKKFDSKDFEYESSDYELANAITKLLKEKKTLEYYKNQGKIRIQDFSSENIKNKWIDLIERI